MGYQFYTVVEAFGFFGFLYTQMRKNQVKKAVLLVGLAFVIFSVLFTFLHLHMNVIDSVQIGVETILVLVLSFYYLYEKMDDTTTLYIYSTFPFWIVIGMVLYLSGSFFIYIFADSLPKEEVDHYWVVTNILSIMKNIFFSIGIIVNSKPPKKLSLSDIDLGVFN